MEEPACRQAGKALGSKRWFFLAKNSDQRKLVFWLEKPALRGEAWNGQQDWLLKKI
jgi:hypothetical protein